MINRNLFSLFLFGLGLSGLCMPSDAMQTATAKQGVGPKAVPAKPAKELKANPKQEKAKATSKPKIELRTKKGTPKKAAVKKGDAVGDHDHDHAEVEEKTEKVAEKKGPDEGSFDLLKSKGPFDDITEPLSKLLKVKRKNGRLVFDLPTSYQDANTNFQQIRTKARGGGGGHGSGNFWTQYFQCQNMGGRIQKSQQNFGNNKIKPDSFVVEFLESTNETREIEIQGDSADDFMIRINGGLNPYVIQINQSKTGFSVQEVGKDQSFAGAGETFEAFCKNHPGFVQQRLLPVMKKFGIGTPVTRFNSITRDHVLDSLVPIEEKRVAEFKKLFADLESEKYKQREEANAELKKQFPAWKDVVTVAVTDESFSVETRSRLQKLIKEMSSEADRELIGLVTSADLKNDTEYLVWLIDQADEKQLPQVVKQLQSITGKKFGKDVEDWKNWLANENKTTLTAETAAEPSAKLLDSGVYAAQMAAPTANLLRLKLDDQKLVLDRQFWLDQFGGKSIKELVDNLKQEFEKSNLPKRWLNVGGGFGVDSILHEHVLFEHVQAAIPSAISSNNYSYGNLSSYRREPQNRMVEQPHIFLKLDLKRVGAVDRFGKVAAAIAKQPKIPYEFFHYTVRERRDSHTLFSVLEGADASLNIMISSRIAKAIFHCHQEVDGKITFSILEGGNKQSVSAENFATLYKENRAFVTDEVYPVFRRFGIQVDQKIGGPLKIENAAKPKAKKK